MNRIIARKEIGSLVKKLKRQRKRVAFTNGVFDILHRGHVEYLAKARSYGDVLIVGLNSDASTRKLKGAKRPIQPQRDRATILSALESVDYVVIFSEETPEKLIMQIHPDVLVKGSEYAIRQIVGAEFVKSYGGSVRRVKMVAGRSSTTVIKKLELIF
ncbi:MAG: D-glycero-beta-D-manno-heptose 1-phosphate adenylyltransferase [candidate division Zixibacteria bacterium]